MTRDVILEYARAVSPRYLAANRREKGVVLDEFCKTTGHHRKSAVRLLCNPPEPIRTGLGRPREYAPPAVEALRRVWEASDRLCSKRLVPLIDELVEALERDDELALAPEVRTQLLEWTRPLIHRRYYHGARRRPGCR